MKDYKLIHAGCVHCNDFPSYICDVCNALVCKYCQNDHTHVKGNLIKCYAHKTNTQESQS